jgi:hypothetical protein
MRRLRFLLFAMLGVAFGARFDPSSIGFQRAEAGLRASRSGPEETLRPAERPSFPEARSLEKVPRLSATPPVWLSSGVALPPRILPEVVSATDRRAPADVRSHPIYLAYYPIAPPLID